MNGIVLDKAGLLLMSKGKIKLSDNTSQSIEITLRANKGELKQIPLIGAEILHLQGGEQPSRLWCENVKKQIHSLNIPVKAVLVKNNEIYIEQ